MAGRWNRTSNKARLNFADVGFSIEPLNFLESFPRLEQLEEQLELASRASGIGRTNLGTAGASTVSDPRHG